MIIRQAQGSDATTLALLNATVHALHVRANPSFFAEPTVDQVTAWFTQRLADPTSYVWLVEDAGVVAAYTVVVVHERAATTFTRPVRRYEIDQIGVLPHARRRGCARRLLEHVCAHARSAGAADVFLKSWAFNSDAHAAFKRLGFDAQVVQFSRSL